MVDVKSTGLFEKDSVLSKNHCKTIYWKTGHSHIKRKVNLEKALAGFEKSGHFFFNKPIGLGYDDGINSAIQVCHLLDNKNKKISEILKELPTTYQTPTMAPFCKDEEKYKVVEILVQQIENRVRWRESILFMIDKGVNQFIEIGPGKVLSGLIKRINKDLKVSAINNEEDIRLININD